MKYRYLIHVTLDVETIDRAKEIEEELADLYQSLPCTLFNGERMIVDEFRVERNDGGMTWEEHEHVIKTDIRWAGRGSPYAHKEQFHFCGVCQQFAKKGKRKFADHPENCFCYGCADSLIIKDLDKYLEILQSNR